MPRPYETLTGPFFCLRWIPELWLRSRPLEGMPGCAGRAFYGTQSVGRKSLPFRVVMRSSSEEDFLELGTVRYQKLFNTYTNLVDRFGNLVRQARDFSVYGRYEQGDRVIPAHAIQDELRSVVKAVTEMSHSTGWNSFPFRASSLFKTTASSKPCSPSWTAGPLFLRKFYLSNLNTVTSSFSPMANHSLASSFAASRRLSACHQ